MREAVRYGSRAGRGVLLVAVLGSGLAFLDSTVVNVILPVLGRELGAGLSALQWTLDGYLLTLSALLLPGGALGDRYGRRRVFTIGLAWFAVASLLCGLAPSAGALVVFRAVQGVGAALLVPGSLALLRSCFAPEDQGRAIGAWAGLSGVTTALGPLLGGWLAEAVSWRAVFLVNLPIAALGIWAAVRFVPESRAPVARRLDVAGAVLAALGLGAVTYALIEATGGGGARVTVAALAGLVALGAFVLVERRPSAMLPLSLFRSLQFTGANAATLALYFGLGGATFLLMLQLQRGLGWSPLASGAALLPLTACILVLSPWSGRLAGRVGNRPLMAAGALVAGVGLALLSRAQPGVSYLSGVLPGVATLGVGLGLAVAPLTAAALSAVEAERAGVASGVNNAVARAAGLLAVAVLPLAAGIGPADVASGQLTEGFRRAMAISAALCGVGGALAWATVERGHGGARPRARPAAVAPRVAPGRTR
ncbi:DHA2 family efflux MFS transporter permease subunit [Anaeromyxobacter terrae]|uniref:DHA2 family efflux MFS transporter permease subunit n=1 Tax=Anaeromyxobacter terrae TaxID=2925406 RepID=UPI001F568234|nr:DHA2 family efflux MFS transporter permease subunit [Anaeromyxobacter sp. SG22]